MKKILVGMAVCVAAAVFAGYEADMAQKYGSSMAVEWQNANDAALAEATAPDVLDAFVKDAASAAALLAEVKPAYATDPLKATQIAAITQRVMEGEKGWFSWMAFWRQSAASKRAVWSAALLEAARTAGDAYAVQFYLDQLRWCGTPCQADAVTALAKKHTAAVRDFAAMVADELRGARLPQ